MASDQVLGLGFCFDYFYERPPLINLINFYLINLINFYLINLINFYLINFYWGFDFNLFNLFSLRHKKRTLRKITCTIVAIIKDNPTAPPSGNCPSHLCLVTKLKNFLLDISFVQIQSSMYSARIPGFPCL